MRVCNLSSGSDGNLTYIETANQKILVDIGLSCLEVTKRLALINVKPEEITAILISHEHSDHIKGLDTFVNKYKTKVYVHCKGINAVYSKMHKASKDCFIEFSDMDFMLGDALIQNVSLPHDSAHCSGYIIHSNKRKISIITDLGYTNDEIISKIKGSSLVYLECNHDVEMLSNNPNYPSMLKARILGKHGHLSNNACAKVCLELALSGTKQIMLSHLSRQNNTPEIAYNTVCKFLSNHGLKEGEHIKISVASIYPSAIFKLN